MNYIRAISISIVCLFSATVFADATFDKAPKVAALAANNSLAGGLQFIYNKSDRVVVIELGNFFPTPYQLYPGESTIAVVSTDRQNITIRSAY